MSQKIEAVFWIKKKDFLEERLLETVREIYRAHKWEVSEDELRDLAKKLCGKGIGGWGHLFSGLEGGRKIPYDAFLGANSVGIDSECRRPRDIIELGLSVPSTPWLGTSDMGYFYKDDELREVFVRDAKIVYDNMHPVWGAIASGGSFDEAFDEKTGLADFPNYFVSTTFYSAERRKKIDIGALQKLGFYRVEMLKDGGLFVQLNKDPISWRKDFYYVEDVEKLIGQRIVKSQRDFLKEMWKKRKKENEGGEK